MPRWSRRQLLFGAAGAALAPHLLPAIEATAAGESLDAIARAKGLRFGSAFGARATANTALANLIKAQCGVIVVAHRVPLPQRCGQRRNGHNADVR